MKKLHSCIHCNREIKNVNSCCPNCGFACHSLEALDREVALYGADLIRYVVAPNIKNKGDLIEGVSKLLTDSYKFNIHPIRGKNWLWDRRGILFSMIPTELWVLAVSDYERDYELQSEIQSLIGSGVSKIRYIELFIDRDSTEFLAVKMIDKISQEVMLNVTVPRETFDYFKDFI